MTGNSDPVEGAARPQAYPDEHTLQALRGTKHAQRLVLLILLGFMAGAIGTWSAWTLWRLEASFRSQQGDFQVGRGLLLAVVLTAIAGISLAIWIMLRKQTAAETNVPGGSGSDAQAIGTRAQRHEGFLRALDTTEHTLARFLQILLGMAAGGVVVGGVWMISHMDVSSRSQAGGIFVGIGMLVALACIAGMYISLEMRLKK